MVNEMRESGIGILGSVPWGTHICHIYQSTEEMVNTLVTYFMAGLENNELCVWVTSKPLSPEVSRAEIERKGERVDERIENGQFEIVEFGEWYNKHGGFNAGEVVRSWAVEESRALKQGFEGLRVSGDTQWVGKKDWKKFVNYEEEMNRIIGRHRMLAICSYPLARCGTTEVIDSLNTHGLTLFERGGNWKLFAEQYSLTGQSGRGASVIEDPNGHIVYASSALAEMLGCQKREMLGAFWTQFVSPEYLERAGEEDGARQREAVLISKTGERVPVLVSSSPVFEGEFFKGTLRTVIDVSEIKKVKERLVEKMTKYRVERGGTYLVKDRNHGGSKDIFLDLLKAGLSGLIVTCTPSHKVRKTYEVNIPVVWLSERKYDRMTIPPRFSLIEKTIESHLQIDGTVLIDRLDYLILKNGFMSTMEFIQRLNELFFIRRGILIISIDPEILSPNELKLLEKEVAEVKVKHRPELTEDLHEILEFIYEQNRIGRKPSHRDVETNFGITRTTARKRIYRLKHLGLIESSRRGKFKVLKITDRGKSFLQE